MKKICSLYIFALLHFAAISQSYTVIMSEIFLNPSGPDDGLEWIELYNVTNNDIDISDYKIAWGATAAYCGTKSYTIPSGTIIQANKRLLIGGSCRNRTYQSL